jgi:hypothetical protein
MRRNKPIVYRFHNYLGFNWLGVEKPINRGFFLRPAINFSIILIFIIFAPACMQCPRSAASFVYRFRSSVG